MSIIQNLPLYKKSDLRYLCERLIPFTSLVDMHYGSNFCPFHYNTNTPAASLFKDADGIEQGLNDIKDGIESITPKDKSGDK